MAVYSVVRLSELEGTKRMDAEFYRQEYLEIERTIRNKRFDYLKNLVMLNTRGIQPIYATEPSPYKCVISQNILEDFLDLASIPSVDKAFFDRFKNSELVLRLYDILVYTTGANIGRTNILFIDSANFLASNHVNIIRVKPNAINPLYLCVYLQSKVGRSLVERHASGSAQREIYPRDIGNFVVFMPSRYFQDYIGNILKEAFESVNQSYTLYTQAENLLLEELGLKDYKPEYKKTYTARLSDCLNAKRMDAEYFQPAYEEVLERVRNQGIELRPLKDFILAFKKGVEVGSENYQEKGKLFIRVSNLSIHGLVDRDQKYITDEVYQRFYQYKPNVGDFLLTKDATPGIAYVLKEDVQGIIASGILNLKIDESKIDKEYLALCINSLIGQKQAERDSVGSVIVHWKPEQIKNLKIPLLPLSIQKQIAELVQKSHEARKKAKELLEVAKRAVEIAIEKSEDEATEWLWCINSSFKSR